MTVLLTILILSILIIVHEAGHFLMARTFGIRVLTFSLGFGPVVAGRIIRGTKFVLSLIPFGGYVKMAGEEPREDENYAPDEYLGKPVGVRALVVAAGPLSNFILGFIIFFFAFGVFGVSTIPGNKVGKVLEDSPAFDAGLLPGDEILEVDGKKFKNWELTLDELSKAGIHTLKIVRREDTLRIELSMERGKEPGIIPQIPPIVGRVIPGTPAYSVGLEPGDTIIQIENVKISAWSEMVSIIRNHPGETLLIKWKRSGEVYESKIVPEATGDSVKIGRIGILALTMMYRPPLFKALEYSIDRTFSSTYLIFAVLYKLLRREISVKTIGGPVMIGKLVGETASFGIFSLLILVALISVNLFVINIIPFPALDGWHLFMYFIEALRGRPLSPKVQTIIQQIGFAILILLIIAITFLDITRIVKK